MISYGSQPQLNYGSGGKANVKTPVGVTRQICDPILQAVELSDVEGTNTMA